MTTTPTVTVTTMVLLRWWLRTIWCRAMSLVGSAWMVWCSSVSTGVHMTCASPIVVVVVIDDNHMISAVMWIVVAHIMHHHHVHHHHSAHHHTSHHHATWTHTLSRWGILAVAIAILSVRIRLLNDNNCLCCSLWLLPFNNNSSGRLTSSNLNTLRCCYYNRIAELVKLLLWWLHRLLTHLLLLHHGLLTHLLLLILLLLLLDLLLYLLLLELCGSNWFNCGGLHGNHHIENLNKITKLTARHVTNAKSSHVWLQDWSWP